ncbi:hypothetical protein EJ08DRAFT_704036 [Tothia fuscella]|uniref:Uncharacterized protein n=1 Tax=Tothia fuscella TaxID=1048955 RepID=A0A9P4TSB7_9PEZI|nr:hypothetical protein EJ08DRAFT_704036 [Tothia fuscella]
MRLLLSAPPAVLLYAEHGSCYARAGLDRYLTEQYARSPRPTSAAAAGAETPRDGVPPIDRLPVHASYRCRYYGRRSSDDSGGGGSINSSSTRE